MKDFGHVSAIRVVFTVLAAAAAAVPASAAPASGAPASGALVSAALAAQEGLLRIDLAQTAAVVSNVDGAVRISFPVRLAFVADAAELLPAGKTMLDLVAASLRKFGQSRAVVAVYTDAIGSAQFNREQSLLRAAAVVSYLRSRGVPPVRLIARGVGEEQPLNAENTPEGRELNRRLELTITALSS